MYAERLLRGTVTPSNSGARRPLWVISGHLHCNGSCPLYPQKRTCAAQLTMSAMGQRRTRAAQQKGSLFDHLVGALLQKQRHIQSEGLSGLHVDNQLELRGRLYRKLGWLGALEDLSR